MKVIVIYDLPDVPSSLHHKLAITLPSKWLELSVDKVRDAFVWRDFSPSASAGTARKGVSVRVCVFVCERERERERWGTAQRPDMCRDPASANTTPM